MLILYDLVVPHADDFLSLFHIDPISGVLSLHFLSITLQVTPMFLVHAGTHHIIPAMLDTLTDTSYLFFSHHVEQVFVIDGLSELACALLSHHSFPIWQRYGHVPHISHVVHTIQRSIVLGVRILHVLNSLRICITMVVTSTGHLMVLQFNVAVKVGTGATTLVALCKSLLLLVLLALHNVYYLGSSFKIGWIVVTTLGFLEPTADRLVPMCVLSRMLLRLVIPLAVIVQ